MIVPSREDNLAPLIDVQDVHKQYTIRSGILGQNQHTLRALDGVSLELTRGTTMGVVGESGCGKSTLARLIVMLERPTEGSIRFRGQDVFSLEGADLKSYRRQVQLVFQDPFSSLPARMPVGRILTEPLAIHGIGSTSERRQRVRELIDLVGLDENDLSRYPHQFSGGQRQRISVARALALEPRLLVCDEPVSSLDVSIQAQILSLLLELQQRLELTYMIISHDLRVIKYMCDELAVLYLGRTMEQGDATSIFERPAHPYTAALLRSIPSHSDIQARGERFSFLQGEVPSPLQVPPGCTFHPRCPLRARLGDEAAARCVAEIPRLRPIGGDRACACYHAEREELLAEAISADPASSVDFSKSAIYS